MLEHSINDIPARIFDQLTGLYLGTKSSVKDGEGISGFFLLLQELGRIASILQHFNTWI